MQGKPKVIALLNEALQKELTAITQYFLHAEMCGNWHYDKLDGYIKKLSIVEMKHVEALIEHILFLDGTPNLTELLKISVGQNVKEQVESDLKLEIEAVVVAQQLRRRLAVPSAGIAHFPDVRQTIQKRPRGDHHRAGFDSSAIAQQDPRYAPVRDHERRDFRLLDAEIRFLFQDLPHTDAIDPLVHLGPRRPHRRAPAGIQEPELDADGSARVTG